MTLAAACVVLLTASPELKKLERNARLAALEKERVAVEAEQPAAGWYVSAGVGLGAGIIAALAGAFSGISCTGPSYSISGNGRDLSCLNPGPTPAGWASLSAGLVVSVSSAAWMVALVMLRAGPGRRIHELHREIEQLEAGEDAERAARARAETGVDLLAATAADRAQSLAEWESSLSANADVPCRVTVAESPHLPSSCWELSACGSKQTCCLRTPYTYHCDAPRPAGAVQDLSDLQAADRARYDRAMELLVGGRDPYAVIAALAPLAHDFPQLGAVFKLRCSAQLEAQEWLAAKDDCTRARTLEDLPSTLLDLARAEGELGLFTEAIAHYREYAARRDVTVHQSNQANWMAGHVTRLMASQSPEARP